MKRISANNRGMALTTAIFITSILLSVTGAGLLFSQIDLKTSGNHKLGTQALAVADSGIHHSLAVIPAGIAFPYSSPQELVGSATLPELPGFSYTVVAVNTAGDTQAILTSTSEGPQGSRKVIVAYVGRGGYALGAVHAPGIAANIETGFSGDSFSINGNDRCGQAPPVPGISTTDPALVTEITNADLTDGGLDSGQMDNVTGAGGYPSVRALTESSPSVAQLTQQFLDKGQGGQAPYQELPENNYGGNTSWGTADSPMITRILNSSEGGTTISGTIVGYGVLIVEDSLTITGNFTFNGLVISRGDIEVQVNGNAGIFGSLLLDESASLDPNLELDVRGNANIRYDSCTLASANGWVTLPKVARLLAWQEKMSN